MRPSSGHRMCGERKPTIGDGRDDEPVAIQIPACPVSGQQRHKLDTRNRMVNTAAKPAIHVKLSATRPTNRPSARKACPGRPSTRAARGAHIGAGRRPSSESKSPTTTSGTMPNSRVWSSPPSAAITYAPGGNHGRARIVFARTKNHAYLSHDAYCSRYPPIDTRSANVRACGKLPIWLEESRKRGNPTWKPVMASGPRQ